MEVKDKALWAILTLAFVLRLSALWLIPDYGFADTWGYRHFWAAPWHVMPLYPLLVWLSGPFQGVMDAGFSTLSVWLVYRLSLVFSCDSGTLDIGGGNLAGQHEMNEDLNRSRNRPVSGRPFA